MERITLIVVNDVTPFIDTLNYACMQSDVHRSSKMTIFQETMKQMKEMKENVLNTVKDNITSLSVLQYGAEGHELVFHTKKHILEMSFGIGMDCYIFLRMFSLLAGHDLPRFYTGFWEASFNCLENLPGGEHAEKLSLKYKGIALQRQDLDTIIVYTIHSKVNLMKKAPEGFQNMVASIYSVKDLKDVEPTPAAAAAPAVPTVHKIPKLNHNGSGSVIFQELTRKRIRGIDKNVFQRTGICISNYKRFADNGSQTGGIVDKLIDRMIEVEKKHNPNLRCIYDGSISLREYMGSTLGDLGTIIVRVHDTARYSQTYKAMYQHLTDGQFFSRIIIPVQDNGHFFTILCRLKSAGEYDVFYIESLSRTYTQKELKQVLDQFSRLGTFTLKDVEELRVEIGKQEGCQCSYFTALNCISFMHEKPFTVTVDMTKTLCKYVMDAMYHEHQEDLNRYILDCKKDKVEVDSVVRAIESRKMLAHFQSFKVFFQDLGVNPKDPKFEDFQDPHEVVEGVYHKFGVYERLRVYYERYNGWMKTTMPNLSEDEREKAYREIVNDAFKPFNISSIEKLQVFQRITDALYLGFYYMIRPEQKAFEFATSAHKLGLQLKEIRNTRYALSLDE